METKWNCPHCGFENMDDPDETVLPLCGGCYEQVFWCEIDATQQAVAQDPPSACSEDGENINPAGL